ncbi:MAG: 3-deoxy-D-manno-octulosonic acid transferase [Chlamydiae bacterium]|nr:3-deoxy-D-manno-octulosonic acid transferase [Chlamydiota bacterium]
MLFNLVYDLVLMVLAIATLPQLLYQMLFHKKYRTSLLQRLGVKFPQIKKNGHKLIWVHAVSVGETKAVSTLVKKIKKAQGNALILVSTVTETGFAEAKRSIPEADYHVFLPFDFNWIIKPIVNQVQPDEVILCETDFWFNFLKNCKNRGAKISLVNGKLSKRSLQRYLSFPSFTKRVFSLFDLFCLQSKHYQDRFLQLGIPKEKLQITGNLKFDADMTRMQEIELHNWKKKLGINTKDLVLVVGSTHDPEEKIVLDAVKGLWEHIPDVSVVIVPRHPERFNEVANILERKRIGYRRYSQPQTGNGQEKVILLDAMGLLKQCYQLADLALVAGSFTSKVGGHNIIEPSWYGVPVLFGPHMHSQPELLELVEKYQSGIQVDNNNLADVLKRLFSDPNERKKIGDAGLQMVDGLTGATKQTYKILFQL